MKLVTFEHAGKVAVGRIINDRIVDVSIACPSLPRDMRSLLQQWDAVRPQLEALQSIEGIPLGKVKLLAPVSQPGKLMAIGANYSDHVEEARAKGVNVPAGQIWFNKQTSCVTGPYDPVYMPAVTSMLDWEVELAVVIGKRCRHVSAERALDVVAGYTVLNDYTCRDWQLRTPTWTLSKSFDSHGPIGPWIVTADEIPDPQALGLRLWVNGELRQQASTAQMIHDIRAQIEHLTTVMTLEPGDVIATGTPAGVAFGMAAPTYLKVGDVVRAEIDMIGSIENRIVAEQVEN
ncbi:MULTISPECIES: fumarylacetoacetate hydrolase family protein [Burkholderia cepacia complex]|uniref:fumarylacetoacetate hydrolase family protein n=1 Tax=Burkholderia cepacia complex TaxID=87882 RepID=UPI0026E019A0|nr:MULTISPECIES: fumarylacetoacetate hydrolase family protein [Burkholderia cepacia complex]MDO5948165.1 fumarylacetoacetate hydrolase family protein [Burkholderia cepacia]MDS0803604.1 fumarylacetoacetate hydrolase family protein [Burkholderia cenocepacia]